MLGDRGAANRLDGGHGVVEPTLPGVAAVVVERIAASIAIITMVFSVIGDGALAIAVPLLIISVHRFGHHVAELLQVFRATATEVAKERV